MVRNNADTGPEIYQEDKLQAARYKLGQSVYVKGDRGVNPAEHKIHKVLDDRKYQLSKDGKVEFKEDGKTPKEYAEDGLQTHQ